MRIHSLFPLPCTIILLSWLLTSRAARLGGPNERKSSISYSVSFTSIFPASTSLADGSIASPFILFPGLSGEDIELHEARIAVPTEQATSNAPVDANTENFDNNDNTASQGNTSTSSNNLAIIVGASSAGLVALIALGFLVHRSQAAEGIAVKQFVSRLGTTLPRKQGPASPLILVMSESTDGYDRTVMDLEGSLPVATEKGPFQEGDKSYADIRRPFINLTAWPEVDSSSSTDSVSSSDSNGNSDKQATSMSQGKRKTWCGYFGNEETKMFPTRRQSLPLSFDDDPSWLNRLSDYQMQKNDKESNLLLDAVKVPHESIQILDDNETISVGSRSSFLNYPLRKLLRFPRHYSSSALPLPSSSRMAVVSTPSPALLRPARPVTPFDLPPDTFIPMQNCPFRLVSREEILQDPVRRLGQDV